MKGFEDILAATQDGQGIEIKASPDGLSAVTDLYSLSFKAQPVDLNSYINSHRVFESEALMVSSVSIQLLQDLDDSQIKSVIAFAEDVAPVLVRNMTPIELGLGDVAVVVPEKVFVDSYTMVDETKVYLESYHGTRMGLDETLSSEINHVFGITVGFSGQNLVFVNDKGLSHSFDVVSESSVEVVKGPFVETVSASDQFSIEPEFRLNDFVVLGLRHHREIEKPFFKTLTLPSRVASEIIRSIPDGIVTANDAASIEADKPFGSEIVVGDLSLSEVEKRANSSLHIDHHIYAPWAHYGRISRLPLPVVTQKEFSFNAPLDRLAIEDCIFVRKKLSRIWYSNAVIQDAHGVEVVKGFASSAGTSSRMAARMASAYTSKTRLSDQMVTEISQYHHSIASLRDQIKIGKMISEAMNSGVSVIDWQKLMAKKNPMVPLGFSHSSSVYGRQSFFDAVSLLSDRIDIDRFSRLIDKLGIKDEINVLAVFQRPLFDSFGYSNTRTIGVFKSPIDSATLTDQASRRSEKCVDDAFLYSHQIGYEGRLNLSSVFGWSSDINIYALKQKGLQCEFGYSQVVTEVVDKGLQIDLGMVSRPSIFNGKSLGEEMNSHSALGKDTFHALYSGFGFDCMINMYALRMHSMGDHFGFNGQSWAYSRKGISDVAELGSATAVEASAERSSRLLSRNDLSKSLSRPLSTQFGFGNYVDLYSLLKASNESIFGFSGEQRHLVAPGAVSVSLIESRAGKGVSKQTSSSVEMTIRIGTFQNRRFNDVLGLRSQSGLVKRRDAFVESSPLWFNCNSALSTTVSTASRFDMYCVTGVIQDMSTDGVIGFDHRYRFQNEIGVNDSTDVVLNTGDGEHRYLMNPVTGECFLDNGDMARAHPTWGPCKGPSQWNQTVDFYIRGSHDFASELGFSQFVGKMPVHVDNSGHVIDLHQFKYFDGKNDTYPTPYDTDFDFHEYGAILTSRKVNDDIKFGQSTHIVAVKPFKLVDQFLLQVDDILLFRELGFDDALDFTHIGDFVSQWTGHYEYDYEVNHVLSFADRLVRMRLVDVDGQILLADDFRRLLIRNLNDSVVVMQNLAVMTDIASDQILGLGDELAKMLESAGHDDGFSLADETVEKLLRVYRLENQLSYADAASMETRTLLTSELHYAASTVIAGAYELQQEQQIENRFFSNFRYLAEAMAVGDHAELMPDHAHNDSPIGLSEVMEDQRIIAPSFSDGFGMGMAHYKWGSAGITDPMQIQNQFSYEYVSHAGVSDGFGFDSHLGFGRYMTTESQIGLFSDIEYIVIRDLAISDGIGFVSSFDSAQHVDTPDTNTSALFNTFRFNTRTIN